MAKIAYKCLNVFSTQKLNESEFLKFQENKSIFHCFFIKVIQLSKKLSARPIEFVQMKKQIEKSFHDISTNVFHYRFPFLNVVQKHCIKIIKFYIILMISCI